MTVQDKQQILQGLVNMLTVFHQEPDEYNIVASEIYIVLQQLKDKWLTK